VLPGPDQTRRGEPKLGVQFEAVCLMRAASEEACLERVGVRAAERQLCAADNRASELRVAMGTGSADPDLLSDARCATAEPTIRFRTASEMLDAFELHKGGREYRRLVSAFERIFGATIFFGTDNITPRAKVVQRTRLSFFSEAKIWYSRDPDQCPIDDHFQNVIVLSDEFYREISSHPIPTDLEAVKALSDSPAVLDLFMWLSYRCFIAKGDESIPLFGPYGLAAQIGSVEYKRPRRFRENLEKWLDTVRLLWPKCPARIGADGQSLRIARGVAVLPERAHE
jgi:Plasmid encoded RepA protein